MMTLFLTKSWQSIALLHAQLYTYSCIKVQVICMWHVKILNSIWTVKEKYFIKTSYFFNGQNTLKKILNSLTETWLVLIFLTLKKYKYFNIKNFNFLYATVLNNTAYKFVINISFNRFKSHSSLVFAVFTYLNGILFSNLIQLYETPEQKW